MSVVASPAAATAATTAEQVRPSSTALSSYKTQHVIGELDEGLKELKTNIREFLKKWQISVEEVLDVLVSPDDDDSHRKFLERYKIKVEDPLNEATSSSQVITPDGATKLADLEHTPSASQPMSSPEEDYPLVERPSVDFVCPVPKGLLLQPHLTSCCGQHLSQEAATRIQDEFEPCPMCKNHNWSTMFDKHFQRRVSSLAVFCRHKDRECGWQGELSAFHDDVQSCPMKEAELIRAEETTRRDQQQIQEETQLVQAEDRELADAQQKPRQKEDQLQTSQAPVADFQRTLQQRDSDLENLRTETQPSSLATASPPSEVRQGNIPKKLTVQCHPKKTAPCGMVRGSSTTDSRFAYFTPSDSYSVYCYEWSTEKWEELPPCPYSNSGLVIINGALMAVGGRDGPCTNRLFTLRQRRWVEEYPPMNTALSSPAVVSTSDGEYVVAIGGNDGVEWTATVELLAVKTGRWYRLTDLPQPLSLPSATMCGDQVYVIGAGADGYSCSLQALLPSSDQLVTPGSIPHTVSWEPLPPLPVRQSTAATLCGQLVIIGGRRCGAPVNSIHQLVDGQWLVSGDKRLCLAVSPSTDRLLVLGGLASVWSEISSPMYSSSYSTPGPSN